MDDEHTLFGEEEEEELQLNISQGIDGRRNLQTLLSSYLLYLSFLTAVSSRATSQISSQRTPHRPAQA